MEKSLLQDEKTVRALLVFSRKIGVRWERGKVADGEVSPGEGYGLYSGCDGKPAEVCEQGNNTIHDSWC